MRGACVATKTRWRDMTEADLAGMGKLKRTPLSDAEQAAGLARMPQERSKYRNVKTMVGTIVFDSKREADQWMGLLARQRAGEISDLERQVKFPLYCPVLSQDGADRELRLSSAVATYVADFTYREDGQLKVVDAKARRISPYPLKKRWLFLQQGIDIIEV